MSKLITNNHIQQIMKETQILKWHNFSINRNFSNTTTI